MIYEICFSPTGGTKKVLDIISRNFDGEKVFIDLLDRFQEYNFCFDEDDLCLIAVPSYGGRVPSIVVEKIKYFTAKNTKIILICVYGNRDFEDTLLELNDVLQERGFISVAAISAIARHSILHEFATDRPNEDDRKQLEEFSLKIKERMNLSEYHIQLPGHRPYKNYKGVPMHPIANHDCVECNICAKECPVSAIDILSPKKVDRKKCISCMHCISACPHHARKLNSFILEMAYLSLKKACEVKKENQLFL